MKSLYCPACKEYTNHVSDGAEYVCPCGERQEVVTTQITRSRQFVYTHAEGLKHSPALNVGVVSFETKGKTT